MTQSKNTIKIMEPGHCSDRSGMCLQRSFKFENAIGFKTVEKLDENTRYLVGPGNFKRISIECRK